MTVVSSGWIDLKDNVSYSSTIFADLHVTWCGILSLDQMFPIFQFRGPFLKTLSNFLGPKAIKLKPVEQ